MWTSGLTAAGSGVTSLTSWPTTVWPVRGWRRVRARAGRGVALRAAREVVVWREVDDRRWSPCSSCRPRGRGRGRRRGRGRWACWSSWRSLSGRGFCLPALAAGMRRRSSSVLWVCVTSATRRRPFRPARVPSLARVWCRPHRDRRRPSSSWVSVTCMVTLYWPECPMSLAESVTSKLPCRRRSSSRRGARCRSSPVPGSAEIHRAARRRRWSVTRYAVTVSGCPSNTSMSIGDAWPLSEADVT